MPFTVPTPEQEVAVFVKRWEGLYGDHPNDPGNWFRGRLVGTMRGVTPELLYSYLKLSDPNVMTPQFMKDTVTLALAARIGRERFYDGTISPLYWCAPASSVMDFGWGAGPGQAIKSTERDMLGFSNADFRFDQVTIAAWRLQFDSDGMEKMLWHAYDVWEAFYDLICARTPSLGVFRQGWHNRSVFRTPKTPEWFDRWRGGPQEIENIPDKPPGEPVLPTAVIGEGAVGADVLAIQKRLVELGYKLPRSTYPNGKLDGIFGRELKQAVLRFQSDWKPPEGIARLVADGWVGPLTRRALFGPGKLFGG